MLRKLLKFDFRSLYRPFVLTWAAAVALALISRLTLFYPEPVPSKTDSAFALLALYGYLASLVALTAVAAVLVIQRFWKGIWGAEGYLTHTLPVRAWQILLSKLIVAVTLLFVSILVGVGSFFLLLPLGDPQFEALNQNFWALFQSLAGPPALTLLTLLLSILCDVVRGCLLLYLAMSIGHLFHRFHLAISAGAYLAILFLSNQVIALLERLYLPEGQLAFAMGVINGSAGPISVVVPEHAAPALAASVAVSLVISALYFFPAAYLLEKKLNLE